MPMLKSPLGAWAVTARTYELLDTEIGKCEIVNCEPRGGNFPISPSPPLSSPYLHHVTDLWGFPSNGVLAGEGSCIHNFSVVMQHLRDVDLPESLFYCVTISLNYIYRVSSFFSSHRCRRSASRLPFFCNETKVCNLHVHFRALVGLEGREKRNFSIRREYPFSRTSDVISGRRFPFRASRGRDRSELKRNGINRSLKLRNYDLAYK